MTDNKEVSLETSKDETLENDLHAEPSGSEHSGEFMHKRKAYRLQQEEKRKVLKTVKFNEKDKDESAKLPKV